MIPFTAHSGYSVMCSGSQLENIICSLTMCGIVAQAISASNSKMSVSSLTPSSANTLFVQSHETDGCPKVE